MAEDFGVESIVDAEGVSKFPREYDESMGITHRQYMTLRLKAKQLFESEEGIDKAYGNIPEGLLNSTKSTREQVLWAFEEYVLEKGFRTAMVPLKDSSTKEGNNKYTFKDEKIKNTLNGFGDLFNKGVLHEGIADIVLKYKSRNVTQEIRDDIDNFVAAFTGKNKKIDSQNC